MQSATSTPARTPAKIVLSVLLSLAVAASLLPSASAWASADADASGDEAQAATAEEAAEADTTVIVASTTVDAQGNVVASSSSSTSMGELSLQALEATTAADDSDGSDSDGTEGDADADSDEVTVADVTTTYSLVVTLSTTAVSSSNSTVKTIKVSKPKLTTTTTTTYSDGTVSETSKTGTYGLTVKCYVRGVGWKKASANSAGTAYSYTASKTTSGKYISAIWITPSDNLKNALKTAGLTFYYRTTTKYFGTLGWAKAGYVAGTTGNNNPLTAVKLSVASSSSTSYSTKYRYIKAPVVQYKIKYKDASSYSGAKKNGATAGTAKSTTKTVASVAMKIATDSNYSFSGGIKYSVRFSKTDSSEKWSSWKSNYTAAGGGSYSIRAIKVKLTGDMADYYDVYYRVYVKGFGWLGWASNGQKAGTKSISSAISAIQVKLVVKGQSAPGSTTYRYVSSSTTKMKMVLKAQSFSSSTKYLILVDRSACRVGIFTGSKNNWTLSHYWKCCVGKASTPTISGSYTIGSRGYSFGSSSYTCYYYTQISGNYLFHSVLYYPGTFTVKDGTMGKAVSHGCVRLTLEHAKWIYNNIPRSTKVYIY